MNILFDSQDFDQDWARSELSAYITPNCAITVIPFAFHETWVTDLNQWNECYNSDDGLYYEGIIHPFIQYGVKSENIRFINYFKDHANDLADALLTTDIVYFVGGFPEKTMERLIELDMKEIVENYNGIIMGWSAGATMQAKEFFISPDKHYKEYSEHQGLELINEFAVKVHYNGSSEQIDCIKRYISRTGNKVFCLRKKSAIIYDAGGISLLGNAFEFKD